MSKTFSYKRHSTSSSPALVASARPRVVVVSAGRRSPYGHPHAEVVARWRSSGAEVISTAERGMVTVSTDGRDLRVETFLDMGVVGK